MKPKNNRSIVRFLIYPRFQLMLIVSNITITLLASASTYFFIYNEFKHFYELGEKIKIATDHPYFKMIRLQEHRIILALMSSFGIAVLISTLATMVISHRLAGPIYKTRKYFETILSTGDVKFGLSFRRGDFFSDLPLIINKAIDLLLKRDLSKEKKKSDENL